MIFGRRARRCLGLFYSNKNMPQFKSQTLRPRGWRRKKQGARRRVGRGTEPRELRESIYLPRLKHPRAVTPRAATPGSAALDLPRRAPAGLKAFQPDDFLKFAFYTFLSIRNSLKYGAVFSFFAPVTARASDLRRGLGSRYGRRL